MNDNCKICVQTALSREITVRSGKKIEIFHCENCDYVFFIFDPTASLDANKLDQSRLMSAGLDIPSIEKDFANGIKQSLPYIDKYISLEDRNNNILEIGGSWGYFLKLLQEKGCKPYGVELNGVRAKYVNEVLNIPCFDSLEECEKKGIKYKQIFLFYVFEYVHDPVKYISRLLDLLEEGGRIVLITPNLADPLKDIWKNEAFGHFFYDENAVNYFKPKSVKGLMKRFPNNEYSIHIIQGYSFVNHISWFLNNAPRTTGMVGGDYYVQDISHKLEASGHDLGRKLSSVLLDLDKQYRRLIEEYEYGNQIELIVYK